MKYSSKQNKTRSTKVSHKSLIGIAVAATVLVIGVVTALSMQRDRLNRLNRFKWRRLKKGNLRWPGKSAETT